MDVLPAVGEAVKWRRQQEGWSQAELSQRLADEGLRIDPSAVARIERAERDVRVGELLLMAVALNATPADLVAPLLGKSLELGSRKVGAAQVLSWFSGNREALDHPMIASLEELREEAHLSEALSHLVEQVAFLTEAIKRKDRPAVVFATTHIHSTVGALAQWMVSDEDLRRIGDEYDIPGDD